MPGMDLNFFKFCSGLRVLGYFMILLVAAIVAVSYHAVVVLTWAPQLLRHGGHSASASAILVAFHVLLVLLLWSYLRVLLVDPGSVPENWRPVLSEGNLESGACVNASAPPEALSSMRPASDRLDGGAAAGYCNRCQNGKPPRCHHCSVCQRCVLKMDHHCVWVVNCVGACNYKFFLLFLLYTFLETTMDTLVLLPNFIKFFTKAREASLPPGNLAVIFVAFGKIIHLFGFVSICFFFFFFFGYNQFSLFVHHFLLFLGILQIVYLDAVLNLAFSLSLLCFIIMHASLLSSNTTSIEVYEKKGAVRWKYDIGRKSNFEQVFGTKKALWFLPLFSEEDLNNIPALHGLDFPTYSDVEV